MTMTTVTEQLEKEIEHIQSTYGTQRAFKHTVAQRLDEKIRELATLDGITGVQFIGGTYKATYLVQGIDEEQTTINVELRY